jgi:Skp family chaperone for outer membrane proteins
MQSGRHIKWVLATLLLGCWGFLVSPGHAQQLGTVRSPILTIESERLFAESAFGRRVAREIEAESAVLAAENRRIEAELTAEEKDLTERRPDMEAAAFRALADAFDEKVQSIRRTQDGKARVLAQRRDADRVVFLQTAAPVLELVMRDAGAGVILERASVFLSANATDVTDLAIERINAALGDGSATQTDSDQ